MSKAGRQKVLTLFSLYLPDLWTHKSLRCVRVQEYDCSSTWTYHSITRYFSPPPTVYARGTLLPFFPSLFFSSRSSLPTSLSMVYRFILSLSLFHLHAHHIHLTFSPLLYLPYFFFSTSCIPPLPLPIPPSLLLVLHTYKSHMEGLLLILTCWGLHLFCLSRDPTMQFPVPGTH